MLKTYMRRNEKVIGSRTSGRVVEKPELQMRYNWHRYFQKIWMLTGMLILSFLIQLLISSAQQSRIQQGIAGEVLRFHVLANSDSKEDQNLKMKVKDTVVSWMGEEMDTESLEQTKAFIRSHLPQIEALAEETIQKEGYSYPVRASLEWTVFPEKTYGDITFRCRPGVSAGRRTAF